MGTHASHAAIHTLPLARFAPWRPYEHSLSGWYVKCCLSRQCCRGGSAQAPGPVLPSAFLRFHGMAVEDLHGADKEKTSAMQTNKVIRVKVVEGPLDSCCVINWVLESGGGGETPAHLVDDVDRFLSEHGLARDAAVWGPGALGKLVELDEAGGGLHRPRTQTLRAQLDG